MISADAPALGRAVLGRLNPVLHERSLRQRVTYMTEDALVAAQRDRGGKSAHTVPLQRLQLA